MRDVTATITIEIEVGFTGTYSPGYAGDRTDPPEPDGIEDLECEGLSVEIQHPFEGGVYRSVNLLQGVDLRNPEVRKLLDNIANAVSDEATEALIEEAREF
jgi:hypothetical protein